MRVISMNEFGGSQLFVDDPT